MGLRVSTSSLYEEQTQNMLNQSALMQKYSSELSTGVSLNQPSDNPLAIGQDIQLKGDIAIQNALGQNAQLASNQLSSVDGSLSTLTDVLQQARSLAVEASSSLQSPSNLASIASQVNQLFQEAVQVANTSYNGSYVFAGSATTSNGPVSIVGNPPTGVTISGNNAIASEDFGSGQQLPLSTSLQQAFNVQASDGSSDVFQTLLNLRDSLNNTAITVGSAAALSLPGQVLTTSSALNSSAFSTPVAADSQGNVAITVGGSSGTATLTFTPTTTIGAVISAINSSGTGVTASFDEKTQKISLQSSGNFTLQDVASSGATSSGNLLEVLGLPTEGDVTQSITQHIADIDNVLNVALSARGNIGATIQTLSSIQSQASSTATTDTTSQSALADTNIASVSSAFALSQVALQAAYSTTSRLEGSMLFDYIH